MLIEFTIGNFRSFKDPVTLNMVAAKLSARDPKVNKNNTIRVDDNLTLLTSAAVYGANASGKSNLVAAIKFMKRFVLGSSRETQVAEEINVQNFQLSTETADKPSFFEVVFLIDGVKYRYGFEANRKYIVTEWLFHAPKIREARLFTRDEKGIDCSRTFKEGRGLEEKTRPNALFLSVASQFNGPKSTRILFWFKSIGTISGLNDMGYRGFTVRKFKEGDFQKEIVSLVKSLDLGIIDIKVDKSSEVKTPDKPIFTISVEAPQELSETIQRKLEKAFGTGSSIQPMAIQTLHTKFDKSGIPVSLESFDFGRQESDGTQKLFYLTGPLIDTLANGKMLWIDEMEARMHPLITRAIIGLFNSLETNPKRAQLIFTTHDTNLLSNKLFRRDQIWFIEKDHQGCSHLYSLAELKVRNDASFENDYIQGRYGAIPFIGNVRQVILGEE
jgi:hypothetical protein